MITERELMGCLMRATAYARRRPLEKDGGEVDKTHHPPVGKGFGHIFDALITQDGISQQQLADRIGIRPQSISEAIATMESQGLVRREASTVDRRAMVIYITEQGRIRHQSLLKARSAHAQRFFSPLTGEEKETLFRILEKLNRVHNEKHGDTLVMKESNDET